MAYEIHDRHAVFAESVAAATPQLWSIQSCKSKLSKATCDSPLCQALKRQFKHSHANFQSILASSRPDKLTLVVQAVAPNLRLKAKPLCLCSSMNFVPMSLKPTGMTSRFFGAWLNCLASTDRKTVRSASGGPIIFAKPKQFDAGGQLAGEGSISNIPSRLG